MGIANRSGTAARRPADLGNKALMQRRWQSSKSKNASGNEDDASHVNSGHLPRPAYTMLRRPSAVHSLFGGEKLSDVAVIDRAGHEIDMALMSCGTGLSSRRSYVPQIVASKRTFIVMVCLLTANLWRPTSPRGQASKFGPSHRRPRAQPRLRSILSGTRTCALARGS